MYQITLEEEKAVISKKITGDGENFKWDGDIEVLFNAPYPIEFFEFSGDCTETRKIAARVNSLL